ncbi:MAG: DNA polymerase III subunit beta [Legionellaceae bacterium]|nr:DNA polymerase III subunit beta [Legionellaceae bacterium]
MHLFTVSKSALLDPLIMVSGAVQKKQTLPILSHILVRLQDNKLSLTATDLELLMTATVPCQTEHIGTVALPARKILDIVRSLEEEVPLSFQVEKNFVQIVSGKSKFKVSILSGEDFPTPEEPPAHISFRLLRTDLLHLLESTFFAIAQQEIRTFLNGLLLECDNQHMTAVAADGHRMAIARIHTENTVELSRFLIPRKSISELLRVLHSIQDEFIQFSAGNQYVSIQTECYIFTTKLIEARYPAYEMAVPKAANKRVTIDVELLRRALTRMMILAHEKNKGVLLDIQNTGLSLITNNQDQEEAIENIEAEVEVEEESAEHSIGVNATYLIDVLQFYQDGLVRLSFSGSEQSMLVESLKHPNYRYLIMPIKI